MQKTVIAAVAVLFSAGSAYAADLGGSYKDAPMVTVVPNWAGLYLGGSLGLGTGTTKDALTGTAALEQEDYFYDILRQNVSPYSFDMNGMVYGSHLGYNMQRGSLVLGLEAAYNASTIEGDRTYIGNYSYEDEDDDLIEGAESYSIKRKLKSYYTAVGRLGYAHGNAMFYGFGGAAWGKVKTSAIYTDIGTDDGTPYSEGPNAASQSANHFGWTAGVGFEYMISDRISTRIQYEHVDLGSKTIFSGLTEEIAGQKVGLKFDTIKVGASIKLTGEPEALK